MMTDLDQIALDTVEAIANIDPDKLKGGRVQALAQAQCLVRDALQELEEVGAENYTLTQELDDALDQVIYWRERAVDAEAERDALAALCQEGAAVLERTANDTLDGRNMAVRLREANTTSLARLKAEGQAEVLDNIAADMRAKGKTLATLEALEAVATKLRRRAEEDVNGR